jgi:hypothetical protein
MWRLRGLLGEPDASKCCFNNNIVVNCHSNYVFECQEVGQAYFVGM